MRHYILFIVLFAASLSCTNKSKISEDPFSIVRGQTGILLDSLLTPYVEELRSLTHNTAGMAIGVTKGEDVVYAKTFGYTDVANGEKADLETMFHIASISKPFSAVAIAKLIQSNLLELSDKIIKYIPEFEMKGDGYDQITIEQILTHTSGIPRHVATEDWTKPSYGPYAMEENIELINSLELDFEPGTKFSYSNSAFDILGIVISRVSGLTFNEYIVQNILRPAGMLRTAFKRPDDLPSSNWALSHSYGLETQEWSPYPYNERLFPSSGVVASLLDMCKWGQLHIESGSINGHEVLDKEHYDLLVSPKYDTPWNDKIGLSWFLQSYLERPIIMHTGSDTGFESMMYIYPDEGITVIVMANRDFARTGRIVNAVSEVLFNAPLKEYKVSAKYPFANTYKESGIVRAIEVWEEMKKDTLDNYYVDDDDILTTGAILENGQKWAESQEMLKFYLTKNNESTYAWRLLGNTQLNQGDTLSAISSYRRTLEINPNYTKGQKALDDLL